jgi:hypothetical protein
MTGIIGRVRHWYVGDKPPPVEYTDRQPRKLTDEDIQAFRDASDHRAGAATIAEVIWVLNHLRRSDPVRVWRIAKDLQWVSKKAKELGIEWDDL